MDTYEFFKTYFVATYGPGITWTIEMTTKSKSKPYVSPRYTMFLAKDKVPFMKSDEQEGYNKNYMSGKAYANFLLTLKEI